MSMLIRIPYIDDPGHVDTRARRIDGLVVELESYAGVLPLVPGDRLEITSVDQDGAFVATAVDALRECWLYNLHVRTPDTHVDGEISIDGLDDMNWMAAELAGDEIERELRDLCDVDRCSPYAFQVATEDNAWLLSFMRSHSTIGSFTVVRYPGIEIDLDFERADLGITGYRPTYEVHE